MATLTLTPHLEFPPRLTEDGQFAAVEQDSLADVRQCVHVLMRTPVGSRPLAPTIGMDDPTFSEGVDPDLLTAALQEQEPRASIGITADQVDDDGDQRVTVDVLLAAEEAEN